MTESRKPKILIWDVEVSTVKLLIQNYGLKNYIKYFDPKDIQRDWILFSVAWKWHGEKVTHCASVKADNVENDRGVVAAFYHALEQADIIVGHNMKAFDLKKFNSKIIEYGHAPLFFKPHQIVDTLQLCRKYFKFSSNKLSYVAQKLGLDAKDESPDWDKVLQGDDDEIRYMRQYNKKDVIVTEQVYDKLKSWHETHFNLNHIAKVKDSEGLPVNVCGTCLSNNVHFKGWAILAGGKRKRRWRCKDCGSNTYGKIER